MLSSRAAIRATRLAAATWTPRSHTMGVRALTVSYPTFKPSVVQESEVPISVYSPDNKAAKVTTIPVTQADGKVHAVPAIPQANEMEVLSILSEEAFSKLPNTVKNMTVKDKMIIITG